MRRSSLIQYSFGIPSQSNRRVGKDKSDSNRQKEVPLSLFADDMILYLKDHKNSTKKTQHKHFQQLAGSKIYIQKKQ
jgi:hypothetical protein